MNTCVCEWTEVWNEVLRQVLRVLFSNDATAEGFEKRMQIDKQLSKA